MNQWRAILLGCVTLVWSSTSVFGGELQLGEEFRFEVGDTITYEFEDKLCGYGYNGFTAWGMPDSSQKGFTLVYMLDCGWGSYSSGKKGNNVYYGGPSSQDPVTVVSRTSGWHTGKLERVSKNLVHASVDDKVIFETEISSANAEFLANGFLRILDFTQTDSGNPNKVGNIRNIRLDRGTPQAHAATATAQVVNGFVVGAEITDAGYGYTWTPEVTITGGGGTGASAEATIADGKVVQIDMVEVGSGYTSEPTISIEAPPLPPKQAEASLDVVNGFVVGATLTEPGYGYIGNFEVPISDASGSGALVEATAENGSITTLTIKQNGSGYSADAAFEMPTPVIKDGEPLWSRDGLVAYYPFDGDAKDDSGNDNDGELIGGTFSSNRFSVLNSASFLNGNLDAIKLNSGTVDNADVLTFSFWLNDAEPDKDAAFMSIASVFHDNEFLLSARDDFLYLWRRNGGSSGLRFDGIDFPPRKNEWVQIILVCEFLSGKSTCYINGTGGASNITQVKSSLSVAPGGIVLGQDQDIVGGGFDPSTALHGSIDDVRIYNRALSATEVARLYAYESTPPAGMPLIAQQPASVSISEGDDASFCVTLEEDTDATYQWQLDGEDLSGETSACLSVAAAALNQSGGQYQVLVTRNGMTVASELATLTVNPPPPRQAAGTLQVVNGFIVGATLTDGGYGYYGTFPVEVVDATGAGAVIEATAKDGVITSLTISQSGSGYSDDATLSIREPHMRPGELYWLRDGLVAYYPFDGDAKDYSGNELDGVVTGATSSDNRFGKFGEAFYFNGSSKVEVLYSHLINPPSYSVTAWARATAINRGFGSVVTSRDSGPLRGYTIYASNENEWVAQVGGDNSWIRADDTEMIVPNEWVSLVETYENGIVYLFKNGKLVASSEVNFAPNTRRPLRIGAGRTEASPAYHFMGDIDDVRIYNRALSSTEVAQLYEYESTPPAPTPIEEWIEDGLVAYYPFDGDAKDYSGNGNDGEAIGGITYGTQEIVPNHYADFAQMNSGISVPANSLNGASQMSFATWVYPEGNSDMETVFGLANENIGTYNELLVAIRQQNLLIYRKEPHKVLDGFNFNYQEWSHFAIVMNFITGESSVFLNGVLQSSFSIGAYGPLQISSGGFLLAQEQDSVGGGFDSEQAYAGLLSNVRIYNRALSAEEVAQLYAYESQPPSSTDILPIITLQPANQSVEEGADVSFCVQVDDETDVTYQWQVNGVGIAGANASCLALPNVTLADDGKQYAVTITRGNVATVSQVATLSVTALTQGQATLVLNGASQLYHAQGTTYTDPGATATGKDLNTLEVAVSGVVNTTKLGSYTLTYSATDTDGEEATPVARTVTVLPAEDPWVVLEGDARIQIDVDAPFSDPGATARDLQDGVLSVTVSGSVDPATAGKYVLTYSATDSDSNVASVTREVIVGNTVSLTPQSTWGFVGEEVVVPFVVTGFNAISGVQFSLEWDPEVMTLVEEELNGQLHPKVTQSATIPLYGIDFYPLLQGNKFLNKGPGKLAMLWSENDQPDIGRAYEDDTVLFALHFTLADTADLETSLALVDDPTPFRIASADSTILMQEVSTPALIRIGNTVPPDITLAGEASMTHEVMTPFVDPGASAFDSVEGDVEVTVTGVVQEDALGTYQRTYRAVDGYGNEATATRTVEVVDTTAPVMSLTGEAAILHPRNVPYTEPGVLAIDAYDGEVDVTVTTDLDVDTDGVYILTYTASDSSGNTATVTRQVDVIPAVSILMGSVSGITQNEVVVPFSVKNFSNITGMQFTLNWDPDVAQIVTDTQTTDVPKLSAVHQMGEELLAQPFISPSRFHVTQPGQCTVIWDDVDTPLVGQTLADDTVLFALHFYLVGPPDSVTSLVVGSEPTVFKITSSTDEDLYEAAPTASITILDTLEISGRVSLFGEGLIPMAGATVQVQVGDQSFTATTDSQGDYLATVFPGDSYEVTATLFEDERPNVGVDVIDIVILRKHILQKEVMSNAMSWVASDTNRDDAIDVADIVGMRKVILSLSDAYSQDAQGQPEALFRFVDASFKDTNAFDTFTGLAEASVIGFDDLSQSITDVDLAGVKLGDANGDWEPPASGSTTLDALPAGARIGQPMADASLGFGRLEVANDGSLTLPVYAMANEPLLGVQFELNWNGAVMALDRISSARLPGFSPEFHASVGEGIAKLAWDDAVLQGVTVDGTEPLLTLHFSRLSEGATGLELEAPVLAGEQGSLGWVQPASVYLKPDNTSQLAYSGAIKAIEVQGSELRLLVDTQAGQSYQLQSTAYLEQPAWTSLVELEGSDTWQEVVLPNEAGKATSAYLRLVPVEEAAVR